MDRVARRGLLARAPGALKGGTSEIVNSFVAVEGGTLRRKPIFEKGLTMPKAEKENPFWFFNIHSVAKHQKSEGGKIFIFGKKSHNAEKI